MDAETDPAAIEQSGAKQVLESLRAELAEPGEDDLQRLLKLSNDVENLNESRLTVEEAAIWRTRAESRRELMRGILARQSGFKFGLLVGFFAGFALTGLFGAMLALHYVVAHQN
jgi:hypothetical protein